MKRTIAVVLAFVLLGICSPSFAEGDISNFKKERIYAGNFSDIDETDWFYSSVAEAFEYKITDGVSETEFAPYEPISLAEAIAFGVKINATYEGEKPDLSSSEKWYTGYVDYAKNKKIIEEDFSLEGLNFPATREQVAYILARSISFTELKNINPKISNIPDVTLENEFYNEILLLYRAGVLTGKDDYGSFYPNEYITRCEVCAMIGRIVNPNLRINVEFKSNQAENIDKKYNAVEISEAASEAVFYIEIYGKGDQAIASGSGFFISEDGVCVTNYHVIDGGYSAKVKLVNGTTYDVSAVLGYDKERDIAILKVDAADLKCLELGNSDEIVSGESVFCIGSPLGLENTLSTGVVSNVNRVEDGFSYIQITAPISNGSSGGAVLNDRCKLIGISSAGYNAGQNLNLAIPSNEINKIARDKNITMYELTTGRKPGEPVPGETSVGVVLGYSDNKNIIDFGKLNNIAESSEAKYSDELVERFYISDVDGIIRYMSALGKNGFYRQREMSFNNVISMIYTNRRDAVLIEYDILNMKTVITYYFEK